MKPFVITFAKYLPRNGRDLFKICRYRVSQGELKFPVNIAITSEAIISLNTPDEALKISAFHKIGLQRLKKKLASGNYPKQSTTNCEEILITSDNVPLDMTRFLEETCKYQQKGLSGPICIIGEDNKLTTKQLCTECFLPDDNRRCDHLIHLSSGSKVNIDGKITEREITEAYCEKGEQLDNPTTMVSMCISCQRPCWEQIYEIPQPAIGIPIDLPDRVADEIDFLNLLFDKKYSCQFIDISQARSIRDIGNECKTEEEFVHKVQVVGHLINDIKIRDVPSVKKQSAKGKNKLLSIAALKVFLSDNYQGASAVVVTNLEHIRTIRDDYPTHTKTRRDVTVSLDALQINFPIQNWQDAWQKVLYAFWESLNKLRLLIQYN